MYHLSSLDFRLRGHALIWIAATEILQYAERFDSLFLSYGVFPHLTI